MKNFWYFILFLSIVLSCALALAPIEVFVGWDMPFVEFSHEGLEIFGNKIEGADKQLGVTMMIALLLMATSRMVQLSMMKLSEKKRSNAY